MSDKNLVKNRMLWPDAIRVISVFLVVLIHVSAKTVLSMEEVGILNWMVGNFFDSFARISVPLFVILSGSLLLHKKDSLQTFYKKRATRIIFPWFFWGTIYLFFNHFFGFAEIGDENIKLLIIKNYASGFWFMPMLVGLYMITPIIKPLIQKTKKLKFINFFIVWFVVASLIPTLSNVFDMRIRLFLPQWLSYLGYFVGGYFIAKKINLKKKIVLKAKILFIINFLVVLLGTYKISSTYNHFFDYFYDFLSIPVVFMSFSAFIVMKDYFEKKKFSKKIVGAIRFFSDHSFGIFLSHILILKIIENGLVGLGFSTLDFCPIIYIPLMTTIIFILSTLLVSSIKRISILRKFAG